MATQKEYSCVKKTKKAFETSLVSLAKEMPLNKISVKLICERAELSRNAFYFHYGDINALIQDIEDNMINEISDMFEEFREIGYPENILPIIQNLTDYLIGRRETTLMLLDSTYSTSFTKRFNAAFSNFFFEYFKQHHKTENRGSYDCFYNYMSSGYCGMLSQWLHDPGDISKRHFIRLAYTFAGRMLITDKSQNVLIDKNYQNQEEQNA